MTYADQIVRRIKNGDRSAFEEFYLDHRASFLTWAQAKLPCSLNDAKDFYQIAALTLYDNIMQGKITSLSCSIKTYLYAVAKNKWREAQRAAAKHSTLTVASAARQRQDTADVAEEEKLQRVLFHLTRLRDTSRKILHLYYYQRRSISEITEIMGYKNDSTTKNMKYKSIQRLKRLIETSQHMSLRPGPSPEPDHHYRFEYPSVGEPVGR